MRVPLNYYQVLGLTPGVSPEQVQQAHRDRVASLPRREFSDRAIEGRRALLDAALTVLANPQQRQLYEQQLASDRSGIGATVEVDDGDLPGALLVLYEVGAYEEAIALWRTLKNREGLAPSLVAVTKDGDANLAVALSALELARDRQQQGFCHEASLILEEASNLLAEVGLFAGVRAEIQAELYRLRPDRILELLARGENRQLGIQLFREVLDARRGIDGTGNDGSGLSTVDFLRFVQKLRQYLTVAEQQAIFEEEARRPSPVASYLAAYALIARGFAQRQPSLIRRAKGLLVKLSARQDVYLEQAVCALLLGQTEEATRALQKSGDSQQLAYIRQHSGGDSDLLAGLCLYSQGWLAEDVFPHFQDLRGQPISLQEYFAEEQVQAYLEELPNTTTAAGSWVVAEEPPPATPRAVDVRLSSYEPEPVQPLQRTHTPAAVKEVPAPPSRPPVRRKRSVETVTPPLEIHAPRRSPRPRRRPPAPKRGRWFLIALMALAVTGIVMAMRSLFGGPPPARPSLPTALLAPLWAELGRSPAAQGVVARANEPLPQEDAARVIQAWQEVKGRALGSNYDVEALATVLVEPLLSEWRARALELKANQQYIVYTTQPIEVVDFAAEGSDGATVTVRIQESREFFQGGTADPNQSQLQADYRVRYRLTRSEDRWRIANMTVLDD
ncbi:MAG: IMS domain-containing protein [Pseudanabaenaceae cyanobacterium]